MSSPLSDNRTYFDAVQNYFLERTGKGLVLSSRDLELLLSWRRSGASAAIVCQGIDEAVDTLQNGPRDLHACRKYVEPRLADVQTLRPATTFARPAAPARAPIVETKVDEHPAPKDDPYTRRLVEACTAAGDTVFAHVYRTLAARLTEALATSDDAVTTAYEFDDVLVDKAYEALPSDDRRKIDAEIDSRYGAHLAMMPPQGREETMRASRRDILQKSYGLVGLVDG